jgi:hypothetical protein
MNLGVVCECGRTIPVNESDAGNAVFCSCRRRVMVPSLEEFRDEPVLLSASNPERRVQRLVAEGRLPPEGACQRCGESGAQRIVHVELECERASTHVSGGPRWLIIPLPGLFLRVAWEEERRVELRGRDTDVPAPVSLCPDCHRQLTRARFLVPGMLAVGVLALSGLVGWLGYLFGSGLAFACVPFLMVIAPLLFFGLLHLASGRRQRRFKDVLRKVPAYAAVLKRYPYTTVRASRFPAGR